jgi:hypothetical protein
MLKIHAAQVDAFREKAWASYLTQLKDRLSERNPALVGTFDDARLDKVVRGAACAAERHGFSNRGPMRLYLDLCIGFGSGFADDPMYPWARKALGDGDPLTQAERAETLYRASLIAIEDIHGPDAIFTKNGLKSLSIWARNPTPFQEADLRVYVIHEMAQLHPQKAAHGGRQGLSGLYDQAAVICDASGVNSNRARVLMSALAFAFGAGCATDAIYGWIGETLADQRIVDPEARFQRLEKKAIIWLDAVVKRQEGLPDGG